jgi:hypothetical protein
LEAVGELCVIDAEQMQCCGVEIVNMHGILNDVVAKIIGFAKGKR